MLIENKIKEFNTSFEKLFKGSVNYMPVVPIIQNIAFERSESIKEPKSITDPLGIYGKEKGSATENKREQLNNKLQSKYEIFFKNLFDFKGSIENFIQKSAIFKGKIKKRRRIYTR